MEICLRFHAAKGKENNFIFVFQAFTHNFLAYHSFEKWFPMYRRKKRKSREYHIRVPEYKTFIFEKKINRGDFDPWFYYLTDISN